MSYTLAITFALLSAAGINIGKALQKHSTDTLPQLTMEWKVLYQYLTSTTWKIGFCSDIGGTLLMIVALSMAPVSVTEPVSGSGLAILAVFSHFFLHERLQCKDLIGVALAVLGVIGVGLTAAISSDTKVSLDGALLLSMVMLATQAPLELVFKKTKDQATIELVAGIQGGMFFGISASVTRVGQMLQQQTEMIAFAIGGVALSLILSSIGFFYQTRGMKNSRVVVVCTITTVSSICSAVLVGFVVLNETVPEDSMTFVGWCASIGSIVVGIVLLMRRGITIEPEQPPASKYTV